MMPSHISSTTGLRGLIFKTLSLPHDSQSNIRHQVEYDDQHLKKSHCTEIQRVELVGSQAKPRAPQPVKPLVRKHEEQKPQDQNSIVDDRAPEQRAACHFQTHN